MEQDKRRMGQILDRRGKGQKRDRMRWTGEGLEINRTGDK